MLKRISLFLLINFAIIFVLNITVNIILAVLGIPYHSNAGILVWAAVFGFSGSLVSLFLSKSMALRSVGGTVITNPSNNNEKWLIETIKKQASQAKIAMPEVAIYHSNDVNAFATGATKNNSLVAVSSALLEEMTADEAEAVLAHEISHIKNGDMITMTLLQGVLNTFVLFFARIIASSIARDSRNGWLVYMIVNIFLQFILSFLASMIAMWFSRHREFRADAGSANLVGKNKMIKALQKLQSLHEPEELEGSLAAFMINGSSKVQALFMSHPPLEKRIEALRNL